MAHPGQLSAAGPLAGYAAIVKRFLDIDSKINVPSTYGSESALKLAARTGHEPVVRLGFAAGAEVNEVFDDIRELTQSGVAMLLANARARAHALSPR